MPDPSQNDEHYLRQAIQLAVRSVRKEAGGPFGAIVVKDGHIIGQGYNQVTRRQDPTAHAEILAIRDACRQIGHFQLDGATVYCSCEPCPMCLGALYWARPQRIVFAASQDEAAAAGFDDSYIYRELRTEPEHRQLTSTHLPLPDRLQAFRAWADQEDKINY